MVDFKYKLFICDLLKQLNFQQVEISPLEETYFQPLVYSVHSP